MTTATEDVVEADERSRVQEAAWSADGEGRGSPDASALSDPALFAVLRYHDPIYPRPRAPPSRPRPPAVA